MQESLNEKANFNFSFYRTIQSIQEIAAIVQEIISETNPKMIVEPFACGSTILSNYINMENCSWTILHMTDINYGDKEISYKNQYKNIVKTKCDYRSLVPWLLDRDYICYFDIPKESDTFNLKEFWSLTRLVEYQNYTIIRSLQSPPQGYYSFGNNFYTSIKGRLFNWLIQKEKSHG